MQFVMILLPLAGEVATPQSSRLSPEGRRGGPLPFDDVSQLHDPRQAQQAGPRGALPSQASLAEGPQDGYADSQGASHHTHSSIEMHIRLSSSGSKQAFSFLSAQTLKA